MGGGLTVAETPEQAAPIGRRGLGIGYVVSVKSLNEVETLTIKLKLRTFGVRRGAGHGGCVARENMLLAGVSIPSIGPGRVPPWAA